MLLICLGDEGRAALDELAEELETTKADVLKRALSLFTVAVRENKNGNQISVSNDDRILKEIVGIRG